MPMPASHKKMQSRETVHHSSLSGGLVSSEQAHNIRLWKVLKQKKCCVDTHLLFIASWVKKFDSAINKTVTVFVITFYLEHYIGKIR